MNVRPVPHYYVLPVWHSQTSEFLAEAEEQSGEEDVQVGVLTLTSEQLDAIRHMQSYKRSASPGEEEVVKTLYDTQIEFLDDYVTDEGARYLAVAKLSVQGSVLTFLLTNGEDFSLSLNEFWKQIN